jgi:hypothetical protein
MTLQIVDHNNSNKEIITSQESADKLRNMFGLSPIEDEVSIIDTITNLKGLLKDNVNTEESPVYAIKDCRENLY